MLLNLSWPAVSQKSVDGTHRGSGVNMQTIKYMCDHLYTGFLRYMTRVHNIVHMIRKCQIL